MPDSGATVLDDLPESIVVEEILVRLPAKDLLRCRAVRKCWRSATSTDKFMLDHHRRQPLLPILSLAVGQQKVRLFVSHDVGFGQQQLHYALWSFNDGVLQAALDGHIIVSHGQEFFICNPVARKCAALWKPQVPQGTRRLIVGFYRHQPSGEYRVLWRSVCATCQFFYHVVAVGSDNARCIREASVLQPVVSSPSLEWVLRDGLPGSSRYPPVHHRGNLHWRLGEHPGVDDGDIMVFDTAAETFRLMCRPTQLRPQDLMLLDMDGTLASCSISKDKDTVDVWVIQDYHAETWSFKHRINLEVDPSQTLDTGVTMFPRMAVLPEGELLIQFTPRRVLRYDVDGRFLGYVRNEDDQEINLWITKHCLRESFIPLPLFHDIEKKLLQFRSLRFRRAIGGSA